MRCPGIHASVTDSSRQGNVAPWWQWPSPAKQWALLHSRKYEERLKKHNKESDAFAQLLDSPHTNLIQLPWDALEQVRSSPTPQTTGSKSPAVDVLVPDTTGHLRDPRSVLRWVRAVLAAIIRQVAVYTVSCTLKHIFYQSLIFFCILVFGT